MKTPKKTSKKTSKKTAKTSKGRGGLIKGSSRKCGNCGLKGHNRRTCTFPEKW